MVQKLRQFDHIKFHSGLDRTVKEGEVPRRRAAGGGGGGGVTKMEVEPQDTEGTLGNQSSKCIRQGGWLPVQSLFWTGHDGNDVWQGTCHTKTSSSRLLHLI